MAKCSFAIWRPLPENKTEPFITATQFVFHTQVGYFGGLWSWFNTGTNAESHFGLSMSGILEQYIDTARQADAQYRANIRALSLECEDKGDPIKNPYTDAQMEVMVRLARWAMDHHDIALRQCRTDTDSGFGWHSMWGAPSNWTPSRGKTCPGSVRIHQLRNEVFPEIFTGVTMSTIPVAIVVKDRNGLDAGAGHVLQSRISTLLGIDVPVLQYGDATKEVHHAVIMGPTKGINLKSFPSHTVFQGADREDTGKLVDTLLGGNAR